MNVVISYSRGILILAGLMRFTYMALKTKVNNEKNIKLQSRCILTKSEVCKEKY